MSIPKAVIKGKIKLFAGFLTLFLGFAPIVGRSDGIAGQFDYYVMALSWSPNWCERTGIARGSPQCAPERRLGWMLHGLWPQYETGWPSHCETDFTDPTVEQTESMVDIMGTTSLAAYEWEKHGTCSGLDADRYFGISRDAFEAVVLPPTFDRIKVVQEMSAKSVEDAFLKSNPSLKANMLTVTCTSGQIQEVRICLTKDLTPRPCGRDVSRDCRLDDAVVHPVR